LVTAEAGSSLRSRLVSGIAITIVAAGCASTSAYRAQPLEPTLVPRAANLGDPDLELSVGKLPAEAVLRVLGSHGQRLGRSTTILEVRLLAGPELVRVSRESFRVRLPTGASELPLETRWILVSMDLPDVAPRLWLPEISDVNDPAAAVIWMGLLAPLAIAEVVVRDNGERYAEAASYDVWRKTILPRTVEPQSSLDLLLVFWPKTGRLPDTGSVELEVRFELERCTWRAGLMVPMD
jgi:hypothetical protein